MVCKSVKLTTRLLNNYKLLWNITRLMNEAKIYMFYEIFFKRRVDWNEQKLISECIIMIFTFTLDFFKHLSGLQSSILMDQARLRAKLLFMSFFIQYYIASVCFIQSWFWITMNRFYNIHIISIFKINSYLIFYCYFSVYSKTCIKRSLLVWDKEKVVFLRLVTS